MLIFEYDKEFGITNNKMLKEDMERLHVQSSNIHSFWFKNYKRDPKYGILYVEFLSGAVYKYYYVAEYVVDLFARAPSKGRYMWRNIRGIYPYERIK